MSSGTHLRSGICCGRSGAARQPMPDRTWTAEAVIGRLEEANRVLQQRRPDRDAVRRMEEALGWLRFIKEPAPKQVVGQRALVKPDGRPVCSWNELRRLLRADPRTVQKWFDDGTAAILAALWAAEDAAGRQDRAA